jgi:hypothetical protein
MLRFCLNKVEAVFNIEITRVSSHLSDLSPEVRETIERVRPCTMTSLDRLASLSGAIEYAVANRIPGAFVECGVWKGGSTMAAALSYRRLKREDVDLFLFDTFEGMPQPGEEDICRSTGAPARDILAESGNLSHMKCLAPIDEVRRNLQSTGYPAERLHFVQGMVEDTIPAHAPEQISILRLDTDWYASTRHELEHLYPRLAKNGVLIIDDYGDWDGARKAVDEYFATMHLKPLLNRIDNTGRICVKP